MTSLKHSLWVLTTLIAPTASAQLTIDDTRTPAQLVESLLGGGVTVTNITFNGQPDNGTPQPGSGSFNWPEGIAGATNGVMLATGPVNSFASAEPGNLNGQLLSGSDPDLLTIIAEWVQNNPLANPTSLDRAVLEFDVVPTHDSLCINFVFASEEYPNYNCSPQFNDAFGFFLSGPGINGPFMDNAANVAQVPGTSLPVTIANVHGPEQSGCMPANAEFYIHNAGSPDFAVGGHTTLLAIGVAVEPGATYHMKIAICDAGDANLDSAVLLQAGGFKSMPALQTGITNRLPAPFRLLRSPGRVELQFDEVPSGDQRVFLLDAAGRLVDQAAVRGTHVAFDLSSLAQGTYVLKLQGHSSAPVRFVVD